MAILPINVYGDQILRNKTIDVEKVDDELIANIADMFETMRRADGVGLAANQVGLNKSLFVIDLTPVEGYENSKPMVFINPKIKLLSEETDVYEEGCLSLPLIRADVIRPAELKIEYLDPDENLQELDADEFLARVIQHEFDHLIGKMIPDNISGEVKKTLQKDLLRIMKRQVDINYEITEKGKK